MNTDFIYVENIGQIRRIILLAEEIWKEHYTTLIGQEQVGYMLEKFQNAEYIGNQIADGYEYYVFEHSEDAGYAGVHYEGERVFISKLYIKSKYRGQGLAKAFINYIKKRFNSCESFYLTVNKGNAGSIEAYKKLGFEITDAIVTNIGEGFYMDDYVMTSRVR